MSNIIKSSRIIKKKSIKEESVFLSDTSILDKSKIETDKSDDEIENYETLEETEKETEKDIEKEIDEEESEIKTESDTVSITEEEIEDKEIVTEEGEYKIKTGDQCLYNNLEDEIIIDDEIETDDKDIKEIIVLPEERITKNRLTTYEKVRILGLRAKQISLGAKILLKNYGNKTPLELAELELKHKVIPFKIRRPLANKHIEIWKLDELEI
jgi:DNA-directed RNA polymerase subunit K/omega